MIHSGWEGGGGGHYPRHKFLFWATEIRTEKIGKRRPFGTNTQTEIMYRGADVLFVCDDDDNEDEDDDDNNDDDDDND